ncbi:MAG: hypothetical protein EOO25_04060 [Comamonadaceae bacterium]|nr:MAG: hypothetical protein EOO25_04060 [Comamonadaceae bacterium]
MTDKEVSLERLRLATLQEIEAVKQRLARYEALTDKIIKYQAGEGPSPSVEEFLMWREDVELALAIKKLKIAPPTP